MEFSAGWEGAGCTAPAVRKQQSKICCQTAVSGSRSPSPLTCSPCRMSSEGLQCRCLTMHSTEAAAAQCSESCCCSARPGGCWYPRHGQGCRWQSHGAVVAVSPGKGNKQSSSVGDVYPSHHSCTGCLSGQLRRAEQLYLGILCWEQLEAMALVPSSHPAPLATAAPAHSQHQCTHSSCTRPPGDVHVPHCVRRCDRPRQPSAAASPLHPLAAHAVPRGMEPVAPGAPGSRQGQAGGALCSPGQPALGMSRGCDSDAASTTALMLMDPWLECREQEHGVVVNPVTLSMCHHRAGRAVLALCVPQTTLRRCAMRVSFNPMLQHAWFCPHPRPCPCQVPAQRGPGPLCRAAAATALCLLSPFPHRCFCFV